MKRLLSYTLVLFAIVGCDDSASVQLKNPQTQLFLEIGEINASNRGLQLLQSSNEPLRSSAWIIGGMGDDRVWLNKDFLSLEDEGANYWLRNWDYKSSNVEIRNFWNDDKIINITINKSHLLVPSTLEVDKIQTVLDDGAEKTYVEIHFSGEAWGVYDSNKESLGFSIKNGIFKGIIE